MHVTKENKMDAYNLAVVLSPNLVHSDNSGGRRFSAMISDMEWNVRIVEKLITHVQEVFEIRS